MKLVDDFYNKVLSEIDKKYFPEVEYYGDNEKDANCHYAMELFSNGCSVYCVLIETLSINCNDTEANIHEIVSKYISDFEGYTYSLTDIVALRNRIINSLKELIYADFLLKESDEFEMILQKIPETKLEQFSIETYPEFKGKTNEEIIYNVIENCIVKNDTSKVYELLLLIPTPELQEISKNWIDIVIDNQ